MAIRALIFAALTAGMGLALPPAPASAQSNNNLGGAIGAIALVCILTPRACQSRPRSHADATVRADQKALNFFEFDAGGADGVMGRRTRGAIERYQAFMGYPITGRLDDTQRATLREARAWAQSERAAAYPGITARELLAAFVDERSGTNYCARTGRCPYAGVRPQPAPAPPAPGDRPGTIPVIPATAHTSVAGLCDSVRLLEQASPVSLAPLDRPREMARVLDREFCDARDYAMAITQNLLSQANLPDSQLDKFCNQTTSYIRRYLPDLAGMRRDRVLSTLRRAIGDAGISVANARNTGKVCLGYGYRRDNAEMALYSAALLAGAGLAPYAEIIGHHSRAGFGLRMDESVAREWYDAAFSSLENGVRPEILPRQSRRRVAAMRNALNGVSQAGMPSANTGFPTFNLGNN